MAEIGLIASVIQVAGAGLKLSQTLYQYAETVASADRRLKDIAREVELTSFVIDELAQIFKQDESSALLSKSALKTADETVQECSAMFMELEAELKKSKKSKMGRLMLPFRESKIDLLRSHIDKMKSTLQLLMQVLTHAHHVASRKLDHEAEAAQREQIKALILSKKESTKRYEESLRNYSMSQGSTLAGKDDDNDDPVDQPESVKDLAMFASSISSTITAESLKACVHHVQNLLKDIEVLQRELSHGPEGADSSERQQSLVGSYFRARGHLDEVLLGSSKSFKDNVKSKIKRELSAAVNSFMDSTLQADETRLLKQSNSPAEISLRRRTESDARSALTQAREEARKAEQEKIMQELKKRGNEIANDPGSIAEEHGYENWRVEGSAITPKGRTRRRRNSSPSEESSRILGKEEAILGFNGKLTTYARKSTALQEEIAFMNEMLAKRNLSARNREEIKKEKRTLQQAMLRLDIEHNRQRLEKQSEPSTEPAQSSDRFQSWSPGSSVEGDESDQEFGHSASRVHAIQRERDTARRRSPLPHQPHAPTIYVEREPPHRRPTPKRNASKNTLRSHAPYLEGYEFYQLGLHRTRSQGHSPAPNITLYNSSSPRTDPGVMTQHPRLETRRGRGSFRDEDFLDDTTEEITPNRFRTRRGRRDVRNPDLLEQRWEAQLREERAVKGEFESQRKNVFPRAPIVSYYGEEAATDDAEFYRQHNQGSGDSLNQLAPRAAKRTSRLPSAYLDARSLHSERDRASRSTSRHQRRYPPLRVQHGASPFSSDIPVEVAVDHIVTDEEGRQQGFTENSRRNNRKKTEERTRSMGDIPIPPLPMTRSSSSAEESRVNIHEDEFSSQFSSGLYDDYYREPTLTGPDDSGSTGPAEPSYHNTVSTNADMRGPIEVTDVEVDDLLSEWTTLHVEEH
ncbi:hypothetical protein CC78DRAFT_575360 [Lojkania enalia]|uniref:Fungal N-terminal domain-containing protein n=1 Tax=Lojkania enalia TaxID=147567 RepID=A0A9P4TQ69_9PLEO|nr:hypothetical protein CC78DRAFT_575360 [Didymosphaeria enalia]